MRTLAPINRRVWVATHLQARRRRRVRAALATLPHTPVLRATWPSMAVWTWDYADPYRWLIYTSFNNGVSWTLIEDYWANGNARSFSPDGGSHLIYVVGVDVEGVEVTERSNAVRPDDAVASRPTAVPELSGGQGEDGWTFIITYDGEDVVSWEKFEDVSGYWEPCDYPAFFHSDAPCSVKVRGVTADGFTAESNVVYQREYEAPPLSPLQTGLLGYWSFEEASGVRADASPLGNHLYEMGYWWGEEPAINLERVAGKLGYGFRTPDGYGTLSTDALGDFATGDFTISIWVLPVAGDYDGQGIFTVGGTLSLGLRAYDYAIDFGVTTDSAPGYGNVLTANDVLAEGVWAHVAVVVAGNAMRIFVNGVEQAYGTYPGAVLPTGATFAGPADLVLGMNPWGYPLEGGMDELAIWGRALTETEVGQLYNYGDGLAYEGF